MSINASHARQQSLLDRQLSDFVTEPVGAQQEDIAVEQLDGHLIDVDRVLGTKRTGDEVRPRELQRIVRARDVSQARGLEVVVVARQLPQAPGAVEIDAAVAGPQATAKTPGGQQHRDGGTDERHVTPLRFAAKAAVDFLKTLRRSADPLLEVLCGGQVHQALHRQATGKVTQRVSAHAVGDSPKSLLGLVQTGILVDLAHAARVRAGSRRPPKRAGRL
jgi:hypothetical protein